MVVVGAAGSHMNTELLELQAHLDREALVVVAFAHQRVCSLDILAMKDIDIDDSHVEAEDNFLERLDLVHTAAVLVVELCKFESLDVAGIGHCSMLVEEHCSVVCMEFVVAVVVLLVVGAQMGAMNMVTVKLEVLLQLRAAAAVVDHQQFHSVHWWLVE